MTARRPHHPSTHTLPAQARQEAPIRFPIVIAVATVLSAVGLTYEIAAGRVLAPYFGTSLLTWTTVIATVLGGFSLGNAVGGFVAERPRAAATRSVRGALVAAAVLMAGSPLLLAHVYGWLGGLSGTAGMLASVIIVFFPASVFITLPSPFLSKLAIEARPGREGSSLGMVMAAGSVGAILGAVLAGFVTLPLIGAAATFAACGTATLLCLPFLRAERDGTQSGSLATDAGAPVAAATLVALFGLFGPSLCQYESDLSCLRVVTRGSDVALVSDGTIQAVDRGGPQGGVEWESQGQKTENGSKADPAGPDPDLALSYTQWAWSRLERDLPRDTGQEVGDAPHPGPNVLFVGGGGYTLPTELLAAYPAARATVVEIDPLVTEVVRRHLPKAAAVIAATGYEATGYHATGYHATGDDAVGDSNGANASGDAGPGIAEPGTDRRLAIVHADGRVFLNETTQRFDAAVMDAFSSASVPAHLVTSETYVRLAEIVDGPVYVNLIDMPDGSLARGVHAVLREIYPYVDVVSGSVSEAGVTNILLAASRTPLAALDHLPEGYAPASISEARAFTDDRSWAGYR